MARTNAAPLDGMTRSGTRTTDPRAGFSPNRESRPACAPRPNPTAITTAAARKTNPMTTDRRDEIGGAVVVAASAMAIPPNLS